MTQKETTTIKLKDIVISDGNFEIKAEEEMTIHITNEKVKKETRKITTNKIYHNNCRRKIFLYNNNLHE